MKNNLNSIIKNDTANKVKNYMEDLYLYLNEIENMIYIRENTENHIIDDEFNFKLKVIEQRLLEIEKEFSAIPQTEENNKLLS